jgi:hypothetical protein
MYAAFMRLNSSVTARRRVILWHGMALLMGLNVE